MVSKYTHLSQPKHLFSVEIVYGFLEIRVGSHQYRTLRYLVGPIILPNRLNGASYLLFLQNTLSELLEDLSIQLQLDM